MSLEEVVLTSSVLETLISHAFTSEREECVGLLLGHLSESRPSLSASSSEKRLKAIVTGLYVLRRSDRRPDRVEVSSEQVAGASKYLEKFVNKSNPLKIQTPITRVIGWYHSHPHITCRPSHVDLRTQQQYQQYLERLFFGIIISTFNTDNSKRGRVELLAFQTLSVKPQGSTLSSSLSTSESNKNKSSSSSSNPQNTNNPLPQNRLNLSTSATKSQTISPRSQPESSPRPSTKDQQSKSPSNLTSEISELNLVGFEESVSSDVLSAEYREINIPIRLVNEWHEFQQTSGSSGSDVSSVIDNALDMLVELQKSLWDEERESYYSSIKSRSDRHPFVCLHSAAVYQKALCRLLEYSCSPLLLLLQERRSFNQTKLAALREEKQKLLRSEGITQMNPK